MLLFAEFKQGEINPRCQVVHCDRGSTHGSPRTVAAHSNAETNGQSGSEGLTTNLLTFFLAANPIRPPGAANFGRA